MDVIISPRGLKIHDLTEGLRFAYVSIWLMADRAGSAQCVRTGHASQERVTVLHRDTPTRRIHPACPLYDGLMYIMGCVVVRIFFFFREYKYRLFFLLVQMYIRW